MDFVTHFLLRWDGFDFETSIWFFSVSANLCFMLRLASSEMLFLPCLEEEVGGARTANWLTGNKSAGDRTVIRSPLFSIVYIHLVNQF